MNVTAHPPSIPLQLKDFDQAVECCKKALKDEKTLYSVRTAEQLWNFQAGWAVELWKKDAEENGERARKLIGKSEANLHRLVKLMGETTERLSLLGSTAKREAVIAADLEGKKAALEKMAHQYRAAYEHSKVKDPYPQLNWLTATVLLSVMDASVKLPEDFGQMIEKLRVAASEQKRLRAEQIANRPRRSGTAVYFSATSVDIHADARSG